MVMRVNTRNADKLQLGGEAIVKAGCIFLAVSSTRMVNLIERIGKARTVFTILINVWRSKVVSRKTKLRIFNTNVKSLLLYGPETLPVAKATSSKLMSEIHHVHPMARSQKG